MGVDNIMVGVTGDLHICHKTDGSMPFGNIHTGVDLSKMIKIYADFAETTEKGACRSCWAIRFCQCCGATRMRGGKFVNPTKEARHKVL